MNILIVEDDPMVEFIHRNYLEKLKCFQNTYSSDNLHESLKLLTEKKINLVLIDIHIKDGNGMDIIKEIRNTQKDCEIIIISAVNESSIVSECLKFGAIDYLIKPFTFERFKNSINKFTVQKKQLAKTHLEQKQIDYLTFNRDNNQILNEKGLSQDTYNLIVNFLKNTKKPLTIQEIASEVNLSHVSVRKYIAYLEEKNELETNYIYLKKGRPYKTFLYINRP